MRESFHKLHDWKKPPHFPGFSKGSLLIVWLLRAGSNEPCCLNAKVLICYGGCVVLSIYQTTLPMLSSTSFEEIFALCDNLCLILQHWKYLLKHSLIYWNWLCYWQVQVINDSEVGRKKLPDAPLFFPW